VPAKTAPPPLTAYRRAVLRLARRDQSEAELRRALAGKGHGGAEVEAAIERLRRERYLDDLAYAERYACRRMAHPGLGPARIRQGLRQRGVPRTEAEAGLRAALDEVDERAVLDALARRYWKQHARIEPERRLPRLWAFLARRGFAPALVRDRLRALWPRWSDALEGMDPDDASPGRSAGEPD
jgi:regulatory protein